MQIDFILQLSLIVIIVLCIITMQGLSILYAQTKEWRYSSLRLIPIAFAVTYMWIGLAAPDAEAIRNVTRSVIMFSCFNAIYVIFTYIGKLSRLRKNGR